MEKTGVRSAVLACLAVAACAMGAGYLWRHRKRGQGKRQPRTPPLTPDSGAIMPYRAIERASPAEPNEIQDPRVPHGSPHRSLLFTFPYAAVQIDSWIHRGAPVGSVVVSGPLSIFFVDVGVGLVFTSRTTGAGTRPLDGDGVLVLVPDECFLHAPIDEFARRLSIAAACGMPLSEYDSAVASFFAEFGVVFEPSDLPPYWLVGLAALF